MQQLAALHGQNCSTSRNDGGQRAGLAGRGRLFQVWQEGLELQLEDLLHELGSVYISQTKWD
jgi:hypothetical protein